MLAAKHRIGLAFDHAIGQMLQGAHPARGNNRHADRFAHGASQSQIETVLGTVTIHAGQKDFAGPVLNHASRPFNRVEAGRLAAAMGEDLPACGASLTCLASMATTMHCEPNRVRRLA